MSTNVSLVALDGEARLEVFELEGAYAGVHYLLTGTDHAGEGPLAFLVSEGVLEAGEVSLIADIIESMPAKIIRERLASPELAVITPFTMALSDEDKEWLLAVLQGVMTFVRRVANAGRRVLVTRA